MKNLLPKNKIIRWLLGFLAAIFASALGVPVWNLVLNDFFIWIGQIILSLMSTIFNGYVDYLHSKIGTATLDPFPGMNYFSLPIWFFIGGGWDLLLMCINRPRNA